MTLLALSCNVHPHDLGVIGPVYEIAEPNLIDVIVAKLRHAEATGDLRRLQQTARNTAHRVLDDPAPVATVTRATKARRYTYDPSLVVPYAITDAEGNLIVPPGTRVNPLDTVTLSKALIFFDARDATQITRARSLIDQRQGPVKLILTGGSTLDLSRRWQMPVFYDQGGALVEKLRIQHVPALVTQDGKQLRIDELP